MGAEGTLGIITELSLRLHGTPEAISAGVCAFPDLGSAVATVQQVIQMGIPVARIEFLDVESTDAINRYAGTDLPLCPHLFVEFHGSDNTVADAAQEFAEIADDFGATGMESATRTEDRNRLWKIRHNAFYALTALKPGAKAMVTDICVPISKLAQAVEETRADIAASNMLGPILGHVGMEISTPFCFWKTAMRKSGPRQKGWSTAWQNGHLRLAEPSPENMGLAWGSLG